MKDAINWEKLRSLANIPRHSVDIRIDVDDCLLTWPSRKRRLSWGRDGHFGNVEYIPLDSDVDWSTAQEYLELELHVIERTAEQCGSPDDFMRVMEAVREEFGDEIDPPEVSDTGINGVVFALAAFGCAPLTKEKAASNPDRSLSSFKHWTHQQRRWDSRAIWSFTRGSSDVRIQTG